MTFDDILKKLEASEDILNSRFQKSNIPMYLSIRFSLFQSIINQTFTLSNPHIKQQKQSIFKIIKYIFHTLKSNLFFAPRADIYIFSSGVVNVLDNGKYLNRLYDAFYDLYPSQTVIIESSSKKQYLIPKKNKKYFRDLLSILIELIAKISFIKIKDIESIELLLHKIKHNIQIEDKILEDLKLALYKSAKRENISLFLYTFFLKMKKPKLIIIEDAHYGSHSILISVAKNLGIKVCEYQHGYIGLSHPAYNYHKNIHEQIKLYLPEYLLTHGHYWSERVRTPSILKEIGLAELNIKVMNYYQKNKKNKSILFISGGTVYKELTHLISGLFEECKALGYNIILRPHPSELPALTKRYGELINKGISIDTDILYDTLNKVEIVVAMEVSTVLFEAIFFTNKIYIMDTKYTQFYEQKIEFLLYKTASNLLESIEKEETITLNKEYFWNANWTNNYKKFIEETL